MSSSSASGYRVKNNTRKKPSHPIHISPYLGRCIVPQNLPEKSLLMTPISTRLDMENQAFDFTPDSSNRSSLVLSDAISQQTNMSSFVQYADLQQAVNLNPASAATLFYNSYGKRNISRSDGSLECGGGEYEDAPSLQDNLSNLAISMPPIYSSQVLLPDYPQNSSSMGCIGEDEVLGAMAGQWGLHHHYSTVNADPTGWADPSANGSGFDPKFSNELALTLATSQPSVMSIEAGQCSDIASSDRTSGNSEDLSLSFGSYRAAPTPQFSQAILGSTYLAAVQEILAQIASFTLENVDHRSSVGYLVGSSSSAGTTTPSSSASNRLVDSSEQRRRAAEAKKAKLLALLQMVDDRYNQCVDEIHTVISAFHAATELDPQIHARFALQTISFLYKGLRERISTQCLAMGEASFDNAMADSERSFETEFIHKQWALQQMKKKEHQLWRPQRGLPEKSVAVLRAWMFQNFLHPYPKDAEKHLLAIKSGLTRNQVSNWFINARVRLWKPMIEEMYSEMNKRKSRRNENNDNNQISLTSCSVKNNSLLRYNM